MKVAITSKNTVTSKKNGQVYDIYNGIASSGKSVQMFLDEEQSRKFNLPAAIVPSKEQLEAIFEMLPVVSAEFDNNGRLENIEV